MSGDENGADPSYVGNDDVNTFYGDVIVAYSVPVVGNGIAQSLLCQRVTFKAYRNNNLPWNLLKSFLSSHINLIACQIIPVAAPILH